MSSPKLPGDEGERGPNIGGRQVGASDAGVLDDAVASGDPEVAAIRAEISDHLATAAERLEAEGASPAESQRAAAAAFGDVGEVGRRVYWIRQGDVLIWRGAIALLVAGLAVSLVIVSARSWLAESQMAGEISALTEQLQKLAEQQAQSPAPAAPAVPAPLEITGTAYISSPDRPAASVPIELVDVQTGKSVRQFTSDESGKFKSGPLAGGDYALIAEVLEDAPKSEQPLLVQSAPISAYPGIAIPPQTLDLLFPYGRLAIELSRPLPTFETVFEGQTTKYETRLFIKVKTPQLRAECWNLELKSPLAWPAFVSGGERSKSRAPGNDRRSAGFQMDREIWTLTTPPQNGLWFLEILDNRELSDNLKGTLFQGEEGQLPPGACLVVASITVRDANLTSSTTSNTNERGRAGESIDSAEATRQKSRQLGLDSVARFGPYALRGIVSADVVSDDEQWLQDLRYNLLNEFPRQSRPPRVRQEIQSRQLESFDPAVATLVPIERRALTTIRIEVPEDLQSWIQEILDQPTPEARADAYYRKYPLLRTANITVVGTAPLVGE
jgi:hypothetical protein